MEPRPPRKEALHYRDRDFLLNALPKLAVGCEIGVHYGHFTKSLLDWTGALFVYAVDPWRVDPDEKSWIWGKDVAQKDLDDRYHDVRWRLRTYVKAGRCEIVRDFSQATLERMKDDELDWIYIDGSHAYKDIKPELDLAHRKVRKGGFITGDDMVMCNEWGDSVIRAVMEYVEEHKPSYVKFHEAQYIMVKS